MSWAFNDGMADGFGQPFELTMGMTYVEPEDNETYDLGVNVGQNLARLLMGGI